MALTAGHGIRRGTKFWRGPDNYDYHVNRGSVGGGRKSLRCARYFLEHCAGRASAEQDGSGFRQTQPHNHDPDRHKVEVRALRHALMERCRRGERAPFKRMFNQERRRLQIPRQAAARIPVLSLQSSMRRARLESRPLIPRTLKAMHKVLRSRRYRGLSKTLDGEDCVYAGRAGSESQKTFSLIFMTRRMRRYMKKVKKIFCDATFSPVPRGIKASQLWTISTVRRHHVIPLVRVLMRKRTRQAYTAALDRIKELVPRFEPEVILTDYEGAEQRALEDAFPDAELHGCLFHYSKAIGGKARKIGMCQVIRKSRVVRLLVRMLAVLPLLPTHLIEQGFQEVCLQTIARRKAAKMLPLLLYWWRTWRPKLAFLSVSGCADRTTNASESDNRMVQDAVQQQRPNVWDFMDGVIELEDYTTQDLQVLRNGGNASRRRKVSAVANDQRITALTEDLQEGNISILTFLKKSSVTVQKSLNRGLNGRRRRRNI